MATPEQNIEPDAMDASDEVYEPFGADEQVVPAGRASSPVFYILITAVIFFIVGYGVSWFTITTNADIEDRIETVVRQAVADALDGADLGAVAGAQAAQEAPRILDVSIDDDPVLGPEDAPITIVEFSDFRCGFCGRFHQQTFYPLLEQYEGKIRFVYRDFPVVGGERAALAAECADDQGVFWPYHDLLFDNQSALSSDEALIDLVSQAGEVDIETFTSCLANETHAAEIQADFADGRAYGVGGTPAFFINGRPVIGAQPITAFQVIIDEILAEEAAG